MEQHGRKSERAARCLWSGNSPNGAPEDRHVHEEYWRPIHESPGVRGSGIHLFTKAAEREIAASSLRAAGYSESRNPAGSMPWRCSLGRKNPKISFASLAPQGQRLKSANRSLSKYFYITCPIFRTRPLPTVFTMPSILTSIPEGQPVAVVTAIIHVGLRHHALTALAVGIRAEDTLAGDIRQAELSEKRIGSFSFETEMSEDRQIAPICR